jgi:FkbM family methyltransferase
MCSLREAVEGQAAAGYFNQVLSGILAGTRLVETDPAGFNLWRTPQGDFWTPATDDMKDLCWVLTEVGVGVYGPADVAVASGDTVLDCGANIGLFTRHALASGADQVIAIEPGPANLECLRRNLGSDIARGRVVLQEKGLWDSEAVLPFAVSGRSSLSNSFVMATEGKVDSQPLTPVTTVDKIVDDLGLSRVGFIKMDIEAAEQRALRSARKTLRRDRPKLAIGIEHEMPTILDNARAVRDIVLEINPAYWSRCGLCIEGSDGRFAPQVLWFR